MKLHAWFLEFSYLLKIVLVLLLMALKEYLQFAEGYQPPILLYPPLFNNPIFWGNTKPHLLPDFLWVRTDLALEIQVKIR